ncbi:hypothetical protein HO173_003228 [Letharia columbiana]|uniref:Uncharacterized protein n=1 Tax=Letharia columbiana TaxID=112416 RepID=A0A8H6L7L6_9LECA|nr:uncharacterized protein HO173_003228 [Letharia columbiana]KAF6238722.1 hypothetical protein HO173_003228 [Letharia columbiana]
MFLLIHLFLFLFNGSYPIDMSSSVNLYTKDGFGRSSTFEAGHATAKLGRNNSIKDQAKLEDPAYLCFFFVSRIRILKYIEKGFIERAFTGRAGRGTHPTSVDSDDDISIVAVDSSSDPTILSSSLTRSALFQGVEYGF